MLSSYPFDVDYEVGDLVMLAHPVEFMGDFADRGEVGIIVKLYDRTYGSHNIYDCRILLGCGSHLDCWFSELINVTRLSNGNL